MFISKTRPIVVPQLEHQRLAGILAYHWGNATFRLPDVDREAFLLGIATHDHVFCALDTLAIGDISQEQRSEQVNQWIASSYENKEAELVVFLHVRRLMQELQIPSLYERLNDRVQDLITTHSLNLVAYEQADTITDLCDLIAFDFSFEADISRTRTVYQDSSSNAEITYKLSKGKIILDKWPFNVPKIEGYILGYEQNGYPENLQPVLLNYELAGSKIVDKYNYTKVQTSSTQRSKIG